MTSDCVITRDGFVMSTDNVCQRLCVCCDTSRFSVAEACRVASVSVVSDSVAAGVMGATDEFVPDLVCLVAPHRDQFSAHKDRLRTLPTSQQLDPARVACFLGYWRGGSAVPGRVLGMTRLVRPHQARTYARM